jgi:hypothetical protein
MHEPLLIASECLAVPCIFNSRLPSSFIDKIDIFTPELVLCGFVVRLDMEGAHGVFRAQGRPQPCTPKRKVFLR